VGGPAGGRVGARGGLLRCEMRSARTPSLALSGDPSERLAVFRLSFPDQSEWLGRVASHFQVDCVGGLLASLGAQEPELLSARLCLWMAGPAGLGGGGEGWVRSVQ
jgi:hypothetical protein